MKVKGAAVGACCAALVASAFAAPMAGAASGSIDTPGVTNPLTNCSHSVTVAFDSERVPPAWSTGHVSCSE